MGSLKSIFRRSGQGKDRRRVLSASTPSADASTAPHDGGGGGGDLLSRPSGTSPSPSSSSTAELERVFRKFDKNGDGMISESELAAVFASLGARPAPEELERMMKEADSNGDGFISLDEFKDLNTSLSGPEDELRDLEEAFAVFDLDGNGRISADELARVLESIGERASVAQCRKMIRGVDLNGDGLVSFEEFRAMMASGSGFGASFRPNAKKA